VVGALALTAAVLLLVLRQDGEAAPDAPSAADFLTWPSRGDGLPGRAAELERLVTAKRARLPGTVTRTTRTLYAGRPFSGSPREVLVAEWVERRPGNPPEVWLSLAAAADRAAPLQLLTWQGSSLYRGPDRQNPHGPGVHVVDGGLSFVFQEVRGGGQDPYVGQPGTTTSTQVLVLLPPGEHRVRLRGQGGKQVERTTDRGVVAADLGTVLQPIAMTVDDGPRVQAGLDNSEAAAPRPPAVPPLPVPAGFVQLLDVVDGGEARRPWPTGIDVTVLSRCVPATRAEVTTGVAVSTGPDASIQLPLPPRPCDGRVVTDGPYVTQPGTLHVQAGSGPMRARYAVLVAAKDADAVR
jgi:hypothetical protein